jgi:hypothetical protein
LKDGYFPHDIHSHDDEKLVRLKKDLTHLGVGIYWEIVERLHGGNGWLDDDMDAMAFALQCDRMTIEKVVKNYDLFIFKNKKFSSKRVKKNIKEREEKSAIARENASHRWNKPHANAMPLHSGRNAIKETKEKERKVKEIDKTAPAESGQVMESAKPETDIQKLIRGWKLLNNIPTEGSQSQAWDKAHFSRSARAADSLIGMFGTWEIAVEAMEYIFMTIRSWKKQGGESYACTLETIVKYSDLYREYTSKREPTIA